MKRINKLLTVFLVGGVTIGVLTIGLHGLASGPTSQVQGHVQKALVSISATVSDDAQVLVNPNATVRAAEARERLLGRSGTLWYLRLPALWFGRAWQALESPVISSQTITSPEGALPRCGDYVAACESTTSVAASTVTAPGVESQTVQSGPREVARLCAAIICVGPFTIPSMVFGPTPSMEDHSVTTPPLTVAAVCTDLSVACSGPTLIEKRRLDTPTLAAWQIVGEGSISARTSSFSGTLNPSNKRIAWFEPVAFAAYVPGVGSIPVTLCPAGCAVPMPPGGTLHGSVTITLTVGSNEWAATIPIHLRW